jgi:hypothetical protein
MNAGQEPGDRFQALQPSEYGMQKFLLRAATARP